MDKKSKTGYVILGLLSDRSLSGYDIKKLIERRFHHFWSESYGQIYPELRRLLGAKMIKAAPDRNAERRKGGKKRRVYSITEKGRSAVFDWLALPTERESARIEFLLKLCFGSLTHRDDHLTNIRMFRSRSEKNLSALRALENELGEAMEKAAPGAAAAVGGASGRAFPGTYENDPYVLMAVRFGTRVYEAYLKWCADAESTILRR
jgi:DNA-binding PadR family transcriptional regulator